MSATHKNFAASPRSGFSAKSALAKSVIEQRVEPHRKPPVSPGMRDLKARRAAENEGSRIPQPTVRTKPEKGSKMLSEKRSVGTLVRKKESKSFVEIDPVKGLPRKQSADKISFGKERPHFNAKKVSIRMN